MRRDNKVCFLDNWPNRDVSTDEGRFNELCRRGNIVRVESRLAPPPLSSQAGILISGRHVFLYLCTSTLMYFVNAVLNESISPIVSMWNYVEGDTGKQILVEVQKTDAHRNQLCTNTTMELNGH